jgi:hypothetical protein
MYSMRYRLGIGVRLFRRLYRLPVSLTTRFLKINNYQKLFMRPRNASGRSQTRERLLSLKKTK